MKNDDLNSNFPGLRLSRRSFLVAAAASGAVIATGTAQAQTLVDETSAQAVALGYVADAKRADAKKFPRYADGQHCANCALFQGKPGDAAGGCALFGTSHVAGPGWCSAWSKKA
jgi:High potential iron-sulfur protein